ncbi:MAG: hypothetical protein N3J91_06975 [Verrucomicrobiae bacterium]|nr:hypothetical protein [Verrucomicrobiae bacterium]
MSTYASLVGLTPPTKNEIDKFYKLALDGIDGYGLKIKYEANQDLIQLLILKSIEFILEAGAHGLAIVHRDAYPCYAKSNFDEFIIYMAKLGFHARKSKLKWHIEWFHHYLGYIIYDPIHMLVPIRLIYSNSHQSDAAKKKWAKVAPDMRREMMRALARRRWEKAREKAKV